VRLFLDTSVLLAAAGSNGGASHFLITEAAAQGWALVTADYCVDEVRRNLAKLRASAPSAWQQLISPSLNITAVRLALDKALVFPKAKDRPVIISALAESCEWLLTLDETDFHGNLGREIYGMRIATPGEFLIEQRQNGLL
jgi:predicted nucleic acid-binding protein